MYLKATEQKTTKTQKKKQHKNLNLQSMLFFQVKYICFYEEK